MAAQDVSRSASAAAKSFVRRSSGLVRSFSVLDVLILGTIGASPGGVLVIIPFFAAYVWPGADIAVTMVFGAILMIFMALVYGLFSAAMPRSGGDYVYNSRVIHPAFGFALSWGITFSLFMVLGFASPMLVNLFAAPSLAALGLITNNSGLIAFAETLNTPLWTFVGGVIGLAISSAIMLFGTRFARDVFRVLFGICMIGSAITAIMLIMTPGGDFTNMFNKLLASYNNNPDTYGLVFQQAKDAGWTPSSFSLLATLMALPYGFYAFVGFTYTAYIGAEVKEPQKSQPIGMLLALLLTLVTLGGSIVLFYNTLGWDFVRALGYLINGGAGAPLPTTAVMTLFLGAINTNPVLNAFLALTYFLWQFIVIMFLFMCPVRNLFAWSFDRLLPKGITTTTSKGVPWVATLVVFAISIVFVFFYVYAGFLSILANYVLLLAVVFFLTSFSAIVFPYVKKDIFESAPPIVRAKVAGIPVITIAGVITALTFAFIIYSGLTIPIFSGPVGWQAHIFLVGLFAVGVIFYYAMRAYRKSQGIDIDLNWQEIPPE